MHDPDPRPPPRRPRGRPPLSSGVDVAPVLSPDTIIAVHVHMVIVALNAEAEASAAVRSAIDQAEADGIAPALMRRIVQHMAQSPKARATDKEARRLAEVAAQIAFGTVMVGGGALSAGSDGERLSATDVARAT